MLRNGDFRGGECRKVDDDIRDVFVRYRNGVEGRHTAVSADAGPHDRLESCRPPIDAGDVWTDETLRAGTVADRKKEYLRENFYGGILAGELTDQTAGEMDSGWTMANNAYQAMVNVIGIDRIVFTTDYPFGNMKAARQFFDRMPITQPEKEKIAHLNAERLFMNYEAGRAPRLVAASNGAFSKS